MKSAEAVTRAAIRAAAVLVIGVAATAEIDLARVGEAAA